MAVGGIVVRVVPGQNDALRARLLGLPGVEIATETDEGFAVVLEGETANEQRQRHEMIVSFPEVTEALVAFQAVEESREGSGAERRGAASPTGSTEEE